MKKNIKNCVNLSQETNVISEPVAIYTDVDNQRKDIYEQNRNKYGVYR